jgi:ankyrin repeat protein
MRASLRALALLIVLFLRAMKNIIIILTVCISGYGIYAWSFLEADASRPVLAIVTDDSYKQIPRFVAKAYLEFSDYSLANEEIDGSPSVPYVATGYDLGNFNNKEILALIDRFIQEGADINAKYEGYSALNGAILANSPGLVEFLLEKGASTNIVVQREGLEYCNGLASLEFAICINNLGKADLSDVIAVLQNKT